MPQSKDKDWLNGFNSIPIKLTTVFWTELEQIISQFVWKQIATAILRKKNGTEWINLLDFRPYPKATVIKTVWYWKKDRSIDQWNKIENAEVNHTPTNTLSLTKEAKIYSGEDSLFNKWCWENWSTTCKEWNKNTF